MNIELNTSESAPSVQEEIFNTLLRTPHRSVDQFLEIHKEQLERDPFLYGCLATHAVHYGECAVRDTQEIFLATLFVSEFPEHREAAWYMLQDFAPYRAKRVVQYITGWSRMVTHTSIDKSPMPTNGEYGVTFDRKRYSKNHSDKNKRGKEVPRRVQKLSKKLRARLKTTASEITIDKWLVKHCGHGKSMNRVLRGAIRNFLNYRENTEGMIEGAILRMRSSLRFLYAKAHLVPGGSDDHWINRCLFHNVAPEGSRMDALKKLIASNDPTEQAEIIMEAKLPYTTIRSLVTISPSVLIALIDAMSPQELLANLATLKREGAFNNPEIKELIQDKIRAVQKVKKSKVDAFKGEIAAAAVVDLDEDTKKLVQDATDAQLKQHGTISVPTALIIDKSQSMGQAIDLGKQLGAAICQAAGDKFAACYLFAREPVRVRWTKADGDMGSYAAWKKKLAMHKCGGMTHLGDVLRAMINENVRAEQIVIITDEGENGSTKFHELLPEYKNKFGFIPDIVLVRMGRYADSGRDRVATPCKNAGANVTSMDVKDIDKISIPNLIQLLSKKSIFDLVQEILKLPLPTKEEWIAKQEAIKASKAKRAKISIPVKKTKKSSKKSGHPATV